MRSKYFLLASVLVMNLLLFSSCLNSSDENIEYSPDAQIYAFSMSSRADTSNLLSATQFTIDQINGKIFNKEPLPYQFQVDSVLLNISGPSSYSFFIQVLLKLQPDSTFLWMQSDSVAVNRLSEIITTAPDGETTKSYNFELNIYQQDPYILSWEKRQNNYLSSPVESQKTIAFNNLFITYWLSGTDMKAATTLITDGVNWSETNPTGLPHSADLSTLVASGNAVYLFDDISESVYKSTDGVTWNPVTAPYTVRAMYGELPAATGGGILTAINHNDTLKFAKTTDFTAMTLMNRVPDDMPLKDFSTAQIDDPTSYSIKYILLSGGTKADTTPNNGIWILQEKNGKITYIASRVPGSVSLSGSSLFFYDNKPYLMTTSSEKNILIYSENSGLDWIEAGENQQLPADFNKRTDASIITDADNYIWIFGGISAIQTQLVDVWRGRLNKFAGI
ncbi:MAG: hypothetical protein JJE08_06980 [Proteiniphilum sp.]|nr:hypothetical protein [Proteiniphilum sp.]